MKRLLTLAVVLVGASSLSAALWGHPGHDNRSEPKQQCRPVVDPGCKPQPPIVVTDPVRPQPPVVRDHRDGRTSGSSDTAPGGVTVTSSGRGRGTPPLSRPFPTGPVVRDHRTKTPPPVVRDHRTSNPAPVVRDHRTNNPAPVVRDHRTSNPAPVVRDHRASNPAPVVRDHRTDSAPVVRDHRTTSPVVRDHR